MCHLLYHAFTPTNIKLVQSATLNVGLNSGIGADADNKRLDISKKYLVEIKTNVGGGGEIAKTITVTPR